MKFAIAALLAATSGMKIDAEANGMPGGMSTTTTTTNSMEKKTGEDDNAPTCLSRDETNKVFKHIDVKKDGQLTYSELYNGTRYYLRDTAKALNGTYPNNGTIFKMF